MFNIKTHSSDFEMTSTIEEYVYKKISTLEKFLGKNHENILCEVELGKSSNHHKSGEIFRVEINIVSPGKHQYYAVAEKIDLYAAIDVVRDEIEREIIAQKEKRVTLFRRGAARFKAFFKKNSI